MDTQTTLRYGWTWIEGDDEQEGDSWIHIGPFEDDGALADEMATILCRNYEQVKREHPEWIAVKERAAQTIVDALNASMILVIGNPMDGIRFVGPFPDSVEANDYADEKYHGEEWWAARIDPPVDEHGGAFDASSIEADPMQAQRRGA
jgi:hypothetical protein